MYPYQFIELVTVNIEIYLVILFFTFIIYFFIYKNAIGSVIDPIFLGIITAVFTTTPIIFLFLLDEIQNKYFINFIFCEIFFILGTQIFGRKILKINKINCIDQVKDEKLFFLYFNKLLLIIFIFITIIYLIKLGNLPILINESRLIIFQNLGIITWVIDVVWIGIVLSVTIKRNFYKLRGKYDYLICILAIFLILTKGGKTDLIFILFALFFYCTLLDDNKFKKILRNLTLCIIILIIPLTYIILIVWENDTGIFTYLINRIITQADSSFMGYNENYLGELREVSIVDVFFGGTKEKILTFFNIEAEERFIFGYDLWNYYYPDSYGVGPNARSNIIGLIIFGEYFSPIFTFIIGLIFSLSRSYLYFYKTISISKIFLFCLVNSYSFYFFIDPAVAIAYIIKICIVLFPLIFISNIKFKFSNEK